jgi:hypothetical protein
VIFKTNLRRQEGGEVGTETEIGGSRCDCSENSDRVSGIEASLVAGEEADDLSNKQGGGEESLEHIHLHGRSA